MSSDQYHGSQKTDPIEKVNDCQMNADIINNNNSLKFQVQEDSNNSGANGETNATNSASAKSASFNSRSNLTLNLISGSAEKKMKCLLCSYTDINAAKIEEHINKKHFDLTSPAVIEDKRDFTNFGCPFCSMTFNTSRNLESHVHVVHKNILSPQKEDHTDQKPCPKSPLLCPVCGTYTSTSDTELAEHVELHFNGPSPLSPDVSNDFMIAKELSKAEEEQVKLDQQREFELLRAQYGMDNEGNFKEQSIKNMQKAVISGELSVTDFYEKQVELKMAENHGVDDGNSRIIDILPRIREKSQNCFNVARTYLCSNLDFYAASYGDRGWGCGYRNLQMMLSALSREKRYADILLKCKLISPKASGTFAMPSISKLQETIEKAWSMGFDVKGREQLGGKVCNSRKWIGATEVVTLLSSLRFQCQIVDARKPSANGLHPKMFDWILRYFQKNEPFKPPLYLQHQGHSRTVIGVEMLKSGEQLLLILDPGVGLHQIEKSLGNWNASNSLKLLRKSIHAMKSEQFQIATVVGIVKSDQEYQANKVIENFLTVL